MVNEAYKISENHNICLHFINLQTVEKLFVNVIEFDIKQ